MGTFDFTVQTKGQICLMAGRGAHIIQRKTATGYAPMSIDGVKLRVSPANTCVLIPFAGDYRIVWPDDDCCASGEAPSFEYTNDCAQYHADHFGSDLTETVVDNGNGTYSWSPAFDDFNEATIRLPACCKLTVEHSATADGPLRLSAGPSGPRVYSFSFDCPVSDLVLTGPEQCLLKTYVQVKRG
ncbi:MAG TPA: hypothetical protein PLB10_18835 [Thiolinea sp.]|nr:hypothetical protein [Thiolinea sp.]